MPVVSSFERARNSAPRHLVLICTALLLAACGGGGGGSPNSPAAAAIAAQPSQASQSQIHVASYQPGVSPFISSVYLGVPAAATGAGPGLADLSAVEFTIAAKPNSVSKAVDVTYAMTALNSQSSILVVPVFGLYSNYTNQVSLLLHFIDGSVQTLPVTITTDAYVDPTGIYDKPTILTARAAGSTLGFDFFYMKSGLGSPVVVDTDGEIRWVVPGISTALSSAYQNGEFVIGDSLHPTLRRLRLDGTISSNPVDYYATTYSDFSHNIDLSPTGFLAEFDTFSNGVTNVESTVAEINAQGTVSTQWDMAAIISDYMSSQGDDPSNFVRPGQDWFHMNATAYDPSDGNLIVSSRENFVIKINTRTAEIMWILGDPTKYWYTFPSLRAKALTLAPGGLYPIGQHAVSFTSDGLLMLFNDGYGSAKNPVGTSPGVTRTYSAVSAYSINALAMTAQNEWNFDRGQTVFSAICSSAYEALGQSILVDYAVADNDTHARLVGLDANHNIVFEFEYPTVPCNTSWNAVPIAFDNLSIN